MLESKAVQNMKVLGSDTMAYGIWNEKFVNVLSIVYPGARNVMDGIIKGIGEGMEFNEEFDWEKWEELKEHMEGDTDIIWREFQEELFGVLIDKTEGEALSRAKSAGGGHGFNGYARMHTPRR